MSDRNGGSKREQRSHGRNNIPTECPSFLSNYAVEIIFLLSSIAGCSALITVQNFYVDRICHIEKNLSWEECRNLTSNSYENDERRVEVSASKYAIYQSLIENGPTILISFFLGSWIDRNGSKRVLVISILGYFLSAIMYTIFSFLPELSPMYILTCSLPLALGGGLTAWLLAGMSLITRKTSIHERSFRLSTWSVSIDGGSTLGYIIGKKAYQLWGFQQVFIITAALYGVSMILAILLISEKPPENRLPSSGCSAKCMEFLDVGSVKETVFTCFKRRQSRRRWKKLIYGFVFSWILILFIAILLQYTSYLARNYFYLYTRNKFGWDFADYSNFTIATSLMTNIGGILMTSIVIRFLKMPDIYVGFITVLSNFFGLLVMISANAGWLMYLGSGIQMFGAITTAVMRSIISKCADTEEHGKIFSFVTCVEMAMPFVAGPLYGIIFMSAVETLPNAIFILPIGIQIILMMFYIYLHCTKGSFSPYSALREETGHNA